MSNPVYFDVIRLSDTEALGALLEIAKENSCSYLNTLVVRFHTGNELIIARTEFDNSEKISTLRSFTGRTIVNAQLRENDTSKGVTYTRESVDPSTKPSLYDKVNVNAGDQSPLKQLDFSNLINIAQSKFKISGSSELGALIGRDVQTHFAAREEALNKLEALVDRILTDATKQRQALDKEYLDKVRALEDSNKLVQQSQDEQHKQRLEALTQKEVELNAKLKSLDDRNSTHVRRELREKLKEAIKNENRLKFSTQTNQRRYGVLTVYILILVFTGVPAFWSYFVALKEPPPQDPNGPLVTLTSLSLLSNYFFIARQVALSITFLATAGFFIRWLNDWAERSAVEEFRMKQMEIDIDRASWLVELIFESRTDKGEELPEDLLRTLSSNLFGEVQDRKKASNAADTLATALLTSASGLKFKLPAGLGELSLDAKGIKSLEKKPVSEE